MDSHAHSARSRSTLDRRSFLRTGGLGLAGAGMAAMLPATDSRAQAAGKPRIAVVRHDQATDEEGWGHPETVKQMVDRAMFEYTGKESPAEAWGAMFKPDDVVGIKLNVRGGALLASQPCVIEAITAGLVAAGVKENNIILWDMFARELPQARFTVNASDQGVRCYSSDKGTVTAGKALNRKERMEALKPYYADEPVSVGDKGVYFSRILTDEITALINVPLIKDHMIAGVTCSLKNHYGSILNPSDLHGNNCDPYLAELNAAAPIRDKARLVIVDGLRALYNGGPHDDARYRWRENCIIAGSDCVAIDTLALKIVEEKREENDFDPVTPLAHYLETAAKLGLGTNDLGQVDLRNVDLTKTA